MNPHIIKLMLKGHQEQVKQQDYFAWLFNQYTMSAVSVAVEHCLAGKKAKSKYIRKPIMQEIYDDTQQQYSESKEECAVFEMKQRIKLLKEQNLPESPM